MKHEIKDILTTTECPEMDTFYDYLEGNMSVTDRRKFEMHLADCEMCSDALEGFEMFPRNSSKSAIAWIDQEVDRRTEKRVENKRPNYWWYGVAALLLISFGLGLFLMNQAVSPNENVDTAMKKSTTKDHSKTNVPSTESDEIRASKEQKVREESEKSEIKDSKNFATTTENSEGDGNSVSDEVLDRNQPGEGKNMELKMNKMPAGNAFEPSADQAENEMTEEDDEADMDLALDEVNEESVSTFAAEQKEKAPGEVPSKDLVANEFSNAPVPSGTTVTTDFKDNLNSRESNNIKNDRSDKDASKSAENDASEIVIDGVNDKFANNQNVNVVTIDRKNLDVSSDQEMLASPSSPVTIDAASQSYQWTVEPTSSGTFSGGTTEFSSTLPDNVKIEEKPRDMMAFAEAILYTQEFDKKMNERESIQSLSKKSKERSKSKSNNFKKASRSLSSAPDINGSTYTIGNYETALNYYKRGNYSTALGHFQTAKNLDNRSDATIYIALTQIRMGKLNEALNTLDPVVTHPNDPDYFNALWLKVHVLKSLKKPYQDPLKILQSQSNSYQKEAKKMK